MSLLTMIRDRRAYCCTASLILLHRTRCPVTWTVVAEIVKFSYVGSRTITTGSIQDVSKYPNSGLRVAQAEANSNLRQKHRTVYIGSGVSQFSPLLRPGLIFYRFSQLPHQISLRQRLYWWQGERSLCSVLRNRDSASSPSHRGIHKHATSLPIIRLVQCEPPHDDM